ncbi:hypothetical protein MtrunA17_Chr5g0408751 [Medicago truncatula]|uniref:Uncharacterized protein n=1 Tax=Medicago truncatula TaxID=3880 RepID=A0A396HV84_MEDTR|nr:hypothetical protein MtrunA17_Chr5g0408751 [Medicago truncatula]
MNWLGKKKQESITRLIRKNQENHPRMQPKRYYPVSSKKREDNKHKANRDFAAQLQLP